MDELFTTYRVPGRVHCPPYDPGADIRPNGRFCVAPWLLLLGIGEHAAISAVYK